MSPPRTSAGHRAVDTAQAFSTFRGDGVIWEFGCPVDEMRQAAPLVRCRRGQEIDEPRGCCQRVATWSVYRSPDR